YSPADKSPFWITGEKGEGMSRMRNVCLAVTMLWMTSTGRAQTVSLVENVRAGDCFRVHIDMSLNGELRVSREGKPAALKLEASATHEFPERILSVGTDGIPEKSARVYETAKAGISINNDPSQRTLRPERRLMVAQRRNGQFLLYCPTGPLARKELD